MTDSGALDLAANMTIGANATLTQNGAITGAGTVTIDAGAKLSDELRLRADRPSRSRFPARADELAINSYNDLNASNVFVPTITGFGVADVIDFYDPYATITGAQYAAGQLNLYAGATVVATLNLSGSYTNTFSVLPVNGGSTYQIDYLGGGTNAAPAGTTSADSYQWVGPVAGFWDAKANWDDVTAGKDPATRRAGQERPRDHRRGGGRRGASRRRQRQRLFADARRRDPARRRVPRRRGRTDFGDIRRRPISMAAARSMSRATPPSTTMPARRSTAAF